MNKLNKILLNILSLFLLSNGNIITMESSKLYNIEQQKQIYIEILTNKFDKIIAQYTKEGNLSMKNVISADLIEIKIKAIEEIKQVNSEEELEKIKEEIEKIII